MEARRIWSHIVGYTAGCSRWHEKASFFHLATILAELVVTHGFNRWMPIEVKEFNYAEFRKALDLFSKKDS
jgi:hypothetical protein